MSDIIKNIPRPDPRIMRAREAARGRAGEIPDKGCPHPTSAIEQFVDEEPGARYYRPTNLFQCTLCNQLLRLVDYNGRDATDG